ncbi:MAG: family 78 glycoside hydrolase catalytic domain, partial [Tepidisphaeraceae bacterium]
MRSALIGLLLLTLTTAALAAGLRIEGLRCEFSTDPAGIDVPHPRLFWRVSSDERNQRQSAYQILVASATSVLEQDRGDLWDSGKIESDQSTFIEYAGSPLASSRQVFWKVRAWDRDGKEFLWSATANWTMGLLSPDEWKGAWIVAPAETESLLLRKTFIVKPNLVRAVVHVSGQGQYELNLNGKKAGEDLLTPGWTNFNQTILYDTRDVTTLLRQGENAAGIVLGNGMYHVVRRSRFAKFTGSFGPLKAILHLRLEYGDGSVETIGTDETWRVNPGPITYNSIYGGEDHDARLEPKGWDQAGFDESGWRRAVRQVRPGGTLRGHSAAAPAVRAIETHKPVGVKTFPDGTAVYDFGQNASFMPRVTVIGSAGSTVRLTPAEVVNDDGTIQRSTMGGASRGSSWWQYIKATDGAETYFPRFYYLGSRYVRADLIPPGQEDDFGLKDKSAAAADSQSKINKPKSKIDSLPSIEAIESVVVHSNSPPAGTFKTSSEQLNRTRDLVRWAMRSNMVSIFTDCPHREKLGWLEQNHFNGPAIRYEFDLTRLFAKNVHDMREAQTPAGLIPNIAPEYTTFNGTFRAAAEWGAAFIAVPWQQYQFTGDADLLKTNYDAMKRYFAYLESRADDDILSEGLGDWYDLGPKKPSSAQLTPPPVTATAMYLEDARLLAQIASVLGRDDDAKTFSAKADRIRAAYNRRFFDRETGQYGTGSQTSYAIPLAMEIVEPSDRERILATLVREVEQNGYGMTSGNVGFRSLLRALADAGRHDVILKMVTQDAKPGYAWQLKRGETSLTESWDANLTSSHNHFMFAQVTEWFYRDLAGIDVDPAGPGFRKIIIRPNPVGDLKWVEASYESIHGPISVRWERDNRKFVLKASIPANTTATVFVPATKDTDVKTDA